MIGVECTGFVGIPVTDRERAVKFYGERILHQRHAPYRDGSLP